MAGGNAPQGLNGDGQHQGQEDGATTFAKARRPNAATRTAATPTTTRSPRDGHGPGDAGAAAARHAGPPIAGAVTESTVVYTPRTASTRPSSTARTKAS